VDLRDPNRRQVSFQVTIINKSGPPTTIPPSYTLLPRIILRADMKGHRVITVRTDNSAFGPLGLTEVDVDLLFKDGQAGIQAADSFQLKSSQDLGFFEFDYVDEQRSKYHYQITYRYDNGLTGSIETDSDADELLIPLG